MTEASSERVGKKGGPSKAEAAAIELERGAKAREEREAERGSQGDNLS